MPAPQVDGIAESLAKTNPSYYTRYADGSQVHQTSSPEIIERMLRMLCPTPGDRVLEIGTGSGYSTALLSHIVGEHGAVISVDIDADMVERASWLLREDGRTNVCVVLGDGRAGQPDQAPFNRIIAWAAAENEVPLSLVRQLITNGILVCPLRSEAGAWIASFRKNQAGNLEETARIVGGFIPMTDAPFRPWLDRN